jgi:ribonuclease P protein component
LTCSADFSRVFTDPRKSVDRFFTLLAISQTRGPARLGLAIAKKQARKAVDRNRLKRLSREAFRHHRDQLQGIDLVVLARHAAVTADNPTLRRSLARHFARIASFWNDLTG